MPVPIVIGTMKVRIPKTILLFLFFLKSFKSISRPAINIMYNKPTVPNRTMLELLNNKLNPWGPTKTPAIINPIIPGNFSFFANKGAERIIISTRAKTSTGSFKGNSNETFNNGIEKVRL